MGKKLLVVDDEREILEMLREYFTSEGYTVLQAANGADALKMIELKPDLILLDVMMPGMDGLELCERIRGHVNAPILFLTARIEEADKVRGFSAGGDDYIIKPFSLIELDARIKAHLRREVRRAGSAEVKFSGDLVIDYSKRTLCVRGSEVKLAKKEYEIIELLAQNAGQVFDKERIYERVWGFEGEGDAGVVAEHIRRIRAKIAKFTDERYIETVWGVGYKWKN